MRNQKHKAGRVQSPEVIEEEAHETSEKLATPAAPSALGAQVKLVAETHEKITGKRSWVAKHSMDVTIGLGLVWSVFRILQFFYPDRAWTLWIRVIEVFLPAIFIVLAVIYRLYPKINLFSFRAKRPEKKHRS